MPADDERGRFVQIEGGEPGQGGNEPGRWCEAAGEGGEPEGGGAGDPPAGSDHPHSDAPLGHVREVRRGEVGGGGLGKLIFAGVARGFKLATDTGLDSAARF